LNHAEFEQIHFYSRSYNEHSFCHNLFLVKSFLQQ